MQANFAITDAAEQAGAAQVGADGTLGLFYHRPVLNERESQVEGRPIYETVPYIKMKFPGEGKKVVDRRARDGDKVRFAQAWKAFEEGQAGPVGGTPIETMPLLSLAQVAALKHLGIIVVEQLAETPDGNLAALGPGGQALRDRAKAWMRGSEAEVKTVRAQMLELQEQLAELQAQNEALRNAQKLADKAAEQKKAA